MRRKEFDVTNREMIEAILNEAHILHLAIFDEEYPYVVPLNYGYEWVKDQLTIYAHGARQGKKMELLKKNNHSGFEVDCHHQLICAEKAADYTYHYRSIIGTGNVYFPTDLETKRHALIKILEHETGNNQFDLLEKQILATGIIQIKVNDVTAKQRN